MAARAADPSPLVYARVAGLGYLIIIVTGIFAEFFVRSSLIVPGPQPEGEAPRQAGLLRCSTPEVPDRSIRKWETPRLVALSEPPAQNAGGNSTDPPSGGTP